MKMMGQKWLLTALLLLVFAPASFAEWSWARGHGRGTGCDSRSHGDCRKHQQVPEGGSTAMYLLGSGLICAGGILVRSRMVKTEAA